MAACDGPRADCVQRRAPRSMGAGAGWAVLLTPPSLSPCAHGRDRLDGPRLQILRGCARKPDRSSCAPCVWAAGDAGGTDGSSASPMAPRRHAFVRIRSWILCRRAAIALVRHCGPKGEIFQQDALRPHSTVGPNSRLRCSCARGISPRIARHPPRPSNRQDHARHLASQPRHLP